MLVETDKLVDTGTIAEMLEVQLSAVSNWKSRNIGFPEPYVRICHVDFWLEDDVWAWHYDRLAKDDDRKQKRIRKLRDELDRLQSS
jgi:phage terminase Nu1 subunit (DNA packaging protein)